MKSDLDYDNYFQHLKKTLLQTTKVNYGIYYYF